MALEIECQPHRAVVQQETNVPSYNLVSSNSVLKRNSSDNLLQVPTGLQTGIETRQDKEAIGTCPSLARTRQRTDCESDARLERVLVSDVTSGPREEYVQTNGVEQEREDCVSGSLIETEGCEEEHIFVQVMECEEGDTLLQLEKCDEGEILFQVQGCDEDQILIQVEEFEDDTVTQGQVAESYTQGEERLSDVSTDRGTSLLQSGEGETDLCLRTDQDTQSLQALQGRSEHGHYRSPQEYQANFLEQYKPQHYNYTAEASDPASQLMDTAGCMEGREMQCARDGEGMSQSQDGAPCTDGHGHLQVPEWGRENQWADAGRKLEKSGNTRNLTPSVEDLEKKLTSSLAEQEQLQKQVSMLQEELRFSRRETEETRNAAASMLDSLNALCEQQAEINKQQGQVEVALRAELDFLKAQLKYKEERFKEMRAYIINLETDKQAKDHALFQHASMIDNLRSALSLREMASQKDKALLKERDMQTQELQVQMDALTKQAQEMKDTLTLKKAGEAGNAIIIEALQQHVTVLVGEKLQLSDRIDKLVQEKQEQDETIEKLKQELNALKKSRGDPEPFPGNEDQRDAPSEGPVLEQDAAVCVATQQSDARESSPHPPLPEARLAERDAMEGPKCPCPTVERPSSSDNLAATDSCRDGEKSPVRLTSLLRSLLHEEGTGSKRMLDAEGGGSPEAKRQSCRSGKAKGGGGSRSAKAASAARRSRRH